VYMSVRCVPVDGKYMPHIDPVDRHYKRDCIFRETVTDTVHVRMYTCTKRRFYLWILRYRSIVGCGRSSPFVPVPFLHSARLCVWTFWTKSSRATVCLTHMLIDKKE
jgi:hypothetical protein